MDIQTARKINEALRPFGTTVGKIYCEIVSKEVEVAELNCELLRDFDSNEAYNQLLRLTLEKEEEIKHIKAAW